MTVNRTTLLDLPLPVSGTESGTWGDTTNNGLTQYMDIAIAGMSNLTSANFTAGALTIETTEGTSLATNITATSAQYAGFRVTSLATNSTITVGNTGTSPARSYRLINADATYSLTFKATGQTGVTLLPGQSALVAFNGTDYVIVGVVGAGSTTDNTVPRFDGTTGEILQSSGVTIDDSNNVSGVGQLNATTLDATNIEVTNIKAKDGTAAASIADSTGKITVSTELAVDNLNLSGNTLSSTDANGNIVLAPNGTGDVQVDADTLRVGDSGAAATITTNGAGNLTLSTNEGTNSGTIVINQGANGDIEVAPNGTGDVYLTADMVRIGDSNANATLTTNGTGDLILNTNSGTNSGSITIADGANGDMTLTPNGNGSVVITNNGTSNALRITQTGSGNAILVEDSANPDSSPFVVDTNGIVITGNTAAVSAYGFNNQFQVLGTTNAYQLNAAFRNDAFSPFLTLAHSRNTSIGGHTVLQNGDDTGLLAFAGSDGTQFIRTAHISSAVDGTPGTNDMPGRLVFSTTADGGSSPIERMRIDSAGNVGIGTTAPTGRSLIVSKIITGSTTSRGIISSGEAQSDVTSEVTYYSSFANTAAASFTLANLLHYNALQGTFGAGSTVTNQFGFYAQSNLTGATNNYGFYSNIASGTGRWNFYAGGTADNYFDGRVGIGGFPESDAKLVVGGTLPSNANSSKAYAASFFVPSSSTSSAYGFLTFANTSPTVFTLGALYHYAALQGTVGAGSAITSQFGFFAQSNLTGATNNYGFYSNIASGTNRWNFYANGTAANYFAGDMQLDKTVTATGTTGAQTINKNAGTVNFAAAATSLVVTDSRVTANSIIICTVGTNDTTMKSVAAVAGAGSFTLHANAAATAETRVNFLIIN